MLAPLLLAALAAAGARAEDAGRRYIDEDARKPFYSLGSGGLYRAARPGAQKDSFAAAKSSGTVRAFIVGGSIAQLYGGGGSLASALGSSLRGARVEALNCGMAGYDSARERLVLEEVLGYSPDLVVLLTGHNDRDPAAFSANLRAMLASARARGVPVVAASPPLNHADLPPAQPPAADPAFVSGWARFLKGDAAGAAERWESARPDAAVEFYRGRAAERRGRLKEANARYEAAARLSPDPGSCGEACAREIREAARAEGALWIDLDAVFRRAAAPRLPGLEMFHDAVHWHPRYDALVSRAVVARLRRAPSARLPWRAGASVAVESWSPDADDEDWTRTLRYALVEIGTLPEPPLRALAKIEKTLALRPSWFDEPDALAERLERFDNKGAAWGMRPAFASRARWLWALGIARLELGDAAGAARELDRAAALDPASAAIALWQGIARLARGEATAAEPHLRRAESLGARAAAAGWRAAFAR